MAGRKKYGDLGRVIGARLDRELEAVVDRLAMESPFAKNAAGEVLRVIVTDWLLRSKNPLKDFETAVGAVHAWRMSYAAGVKKEPADAPAPTGKKRKRTGP